MECPDVWQDILMSVQTPECSDMCTSVSKVFGCMFRCLDIQLNAQTGVRTITEYLLSVKTCVQQSF